MNEPSKDDLVRNLKQKVEECAKIIVYQQSTERNGKLGHQVLQTGIFKPDEINRGINKKHERLYGNYTKYLKVNCFLAIRILLW
jgi:hypothetical protein